MSIRAQTISAKEAAELIENNTGLITSGFVGNGFPEFLVIEIERRFLETGEPKNLDLFFVAGQGDGKEKGLNHFGHEGMIKFVLGAHFGLVPKITRLITEEKVEAYALPQGVISHLIRAASGNKPGIFTRVGLGTFVDPRNSAGALNSISKEKFVELKTIDGEEYLFYRTRPYKRIKVALIRGTTADIYGNITMEKEADTLETLSIATLTKNNGGIVIAQVQRIAKAGTLHPQMVRIPGQLVDYIVVSPEEYHWQTFSEKYNPAYSGEIKIPESVFPKINLNARKIIGRRAALELKKGAVINVGIGMPEYVAAVAGEEGIFDQLIFTVEAGTIGGVPAGGLSFGAAYNPWAIIDQPYQFDFYHGGGLDIAFLGMAEVDEEGNVNVSKFGSKLPGPGGFIDISQNARKVVFCGMMTVGAEIAIKEGKLKIIKEGKKRKFIKKVQHVTFSGKYAKKFGQEILYVTERAVFRLGDKGLELIEYAPGVDIEKDVLSVMDFEPIIKDPKEIPEFIFSDGLMGLKKRFISEHVNQQTNDNKRT